ncbi:MAG: protein YgfX [Candidatus Contendobacter sp.]
MRDFPNWALEPRPSRFLLIISHSLYLLAGLAVVLSGVSPGVKAGCLILLGLSFYLFRIGDSVDHDRHCVTRIEWIDGRWRLETADGARVSASLVSAYTHPLLVILNFRLEKGRLRSLTLLPDSADAESLRQLRVWLRVRRLDAAEELP